MGFQSPMPHVSLADAVRYLRTKKEMSTRQLSAAAGLSPSYVSKLEAGEIEPSLRAFGKIALVLSMSNQEIFFCVVMEGLHDLSLRSCRTPTLESSNPVHT